MDRMDIPLNTTRKNALGECEDLSFADAVLEITTLMRTDNAYPTATMAGLRLDNGNTYYPVASFGAQRQTNALQGLVSTLTATTRQEVAMAVAAIVDRDFSTNTPKLVLAAEYLRWPVRDLNWQALLMAIMAQQALSLGRIRELGAQNVIDAAAEHLRREYGGTGYTFDEAIAIIRAG